MMEPTEIAAAVRTVRLDLADYLDGLDDADWTVPSLCSAWTVRDVVAHLTLTTRATIPFLLRSAIRARGSFDRMEETIARERAARYPSAELVAQLRESAGSSRRTPGSTPMDPLMDLLIHGQDIARPVGKPHAMPTQLALPSLAYVAGNRFMGGPERVAGLELVATDAEWSGGEGPAVRGTAEDLLLAAAGRAAALPHLSGPGVARLAERLS
ncbi:MAG: maleylpyruvate isomerase family mycothiol-dependent enzyme [Pseudonocardia sp.]|nr:maleylpyruvate isomerase family mycothiol-dependent enzyme [Pseudonocardia sp.]